MDDSPYNQGFKMFNKFTDETLLVTNRPDIQNILESAILSLTNAESR